MLLVVSVVGGAPPPPRVSYSADKEWVHKSVV